MQITKYPIYLTKYYVFFNVDIMTEWVNAIIHTIKDNAILQFRLSLLSYHNLDIILTYSPAVLTFRQKYG